MNEVAKTEQKQNTLNIFSDERSFNLAVRMANCLASSTIVPRDYQKNQGNCMIAIEMANRIGTAPMMVMQNLYIVNGRPAWTSQWIIAMINSSHRYKMELQFEFGFDKKDGGLSCMAWTEDYNGHRVCGPKITMNMANAEGWTSKSGSKWRTMPEVMIRYRAASFFGRMNCPDMIMGIYSTDEIIDGNFIDVDPNEVTELNIVRPEGSAETMDASGNEVITQEQRQLLFKLAKEVEPENCNSFLKQLLESYNYHTTADLPVKVFEAIMKDIEDYDHVASVDETDDGEKIPGSEE